MSQHLSVTDRTQIEIALAAGLSVFEIAKSLGKHRSTISREIRKHVAIIDKGAPYKPRNNCIHRKKCSMYGLCDDKPNCTRKCSTCSFCNNVCPEYTEEVCPLLSEPPYVCNGCSSRNSCTLKKQIYSAKTADAEYNETLSSAREGFNLTTLQLRNIDSIVSPLMKQGQSIHNIFVHNGDCLQVSESTVARLVRNGVLAATVLDQQRVVKLKPRKRKPREKRIDRKCREGRTYTDYLLYMQKHPDTVAVQMDTVIGKIGGKCLFTMEFPKAELIVAFLCNSNTAAEIQSHIDFLYEGLGTDFLGLFPVLLTDNGSEFSNPSAVEVARDGTERTKVFYCDPLASWQKGTIERNHEFIRLILPKGTSFDGLTESQLALILSHINSYSRKSLGDKSPFEMFDFLYGRNLLDKLLHLLGLKEISPSEIVLTPLLLK